MKIERICQSSGIYTITNVLDGKIYVGYATNLEKRKSEHFSELKYNYHDNGRLQNAVNKYGIENFVFEILEECEEKYLCSLENYWCNLLNVHNDKFGYNIKSTSNDCRCRHSEATKKKMSESASREPKSKDSIDKMKETKRLNPNYYTNEEKIAHKQGQRDRLGKKVIILDLNNQVLEKFNSIAEARDKLNIGKAIYNVLGKRIKSCNGFVSVYADEYDPNKDYSVKYSKQYKNKKYIDKYDTKNITFY